MVLAQRNSLRMSRHEWEVIQKHKSNHKIVLDPSIDEVDENSNRSKVVEEKKPQIAETHESINNSGSLNQSSKIKFDQINERIQGILDREESYKDMIENASKTVNEIKDKFISKASEKTMAHYLEKIAHGLQKECGEKPYVNKLGQTDQTDKYY